MENERPKCLQCHFYFSSFDPSSPRGCKKYKFTSKFMPSQVVEKESGQSCQFYEQKGHFKQDKSLSFDDDSYWD